MGDLTEPKPPDGASTEAVHWWWRGKMEAEVSTLKLGVAKIGDKVDNLRTETIPDIKTKISKIVLLGGVALFFGNIAAAVVVAVIVKWITKGM